MTLYNSVDPVVLCTDQVVGSAAIVLGGSLAAPKIQSLENMEAIITDISVTAGTMPANTTIQTYLYKGTTLLAPVISNTLIACTSATGIISTVQTHPQIGQADGYMTIVTLHAMSGTPYTCTVSVTPVNQLTDNYVSFAGTADSVTFSGIVAGALTGTSAATISMYVVDAAGAAISVPQSFKVWVSTDATGATPRVIGAQSTFAIGANGAFPFTYTTGIAKEVVTTAAGRADFTVIETAAATLYLNVALSNKKIMHQALTFA